MKCIALLLFAGMVLFPRDLASQTTPPTPKQVTVRIFSMQTLRKLTITPVGSGNSIRSCDTCKKQPLSSPTTIEVDAGQLRYGPAAPSKQLLLHGNFRLRPEGSGETASASGDWALSSRASAVQVLLTLPLERYVMAVLSGEAARDEPLESLKAMAVAMRTFALVNKDKHASEGFGLCDNTHCQVSRYGKVRPEIEKAVLSTTGQTLWSAKQLARVNYTEHCGGVSEDAGNVWSGGDRLPYLISHPDPYCLRRSTAEWYSELTLDQLASIGKKEGWQLPEKIEAVQITKRTPSGRAMTIDFSGNNTHAALPAQVFRFAVDRALGLYQVRSDWYFVSLSNGKLRFDGKGFGHGVGLCQAGAWQMATEGKNYREILSFYFPGTEIHSPPQPAVKKEKKEVKKPEEKDAVSKGVQKQKTKPRK